MKLTRRAVIQSGAVALVAPAFPIIGTSSLVSPANAQDKAWKHGLSLFGEPRYAAGFKQFDYVNPNAPKGGVVRMMAIGTFDNFNPVVAGVKGSVVAGLELITDTLFTPASDEIAVGY